MVAQAPSSEPALPGGGRKLGTIYDIARAAGVSHQTVSRYMHGVRLRPETAAKVDRALEELEYRPNLTARALTTGRSHRIGVLTHELDLVGPSRTVKAATQAAKEAGYLLDIVTLDAGNAKAIRAALDLLIQHDLAGVIALASTDEMRLAFERTSFAVPAVIAGEEDTAARARSSVLSGSGLPELIGYLADLGHRDFLHVAGPTTWPAARNRAQAYESAVASRGLRSLGAVHGDWSAKSGYDIVRQLPGDALPTAVVAANDQMALGVLLALFERGLKVPDDVSVSGIDDIPEAAYFSPPLTTLRLDFDREGRAAVAELLAQIEDGQPAPTGSVRAELIVRASTGSSPAASR